MQVTENIERTVPQIVWEMMGAGDGPPAASQRLKEDLGADDLDLVEIVMALEEDFEIDIPHQAELAWRTVQDVIDCVRNVSSQGTSR